VRLRDQRQAAGQGASIRLEGISDAWGLADSKGESTSIVAIASRRGNLQHAIEDVENQVSLLRARVAGVEKSRASLKLAELEFERAKQLITSTTISQQEYDRRQATLSVARAQLTQSLADVYQIRVSLGLPAQPEGDRDLGKVPPDLDQTFSSTASRARRDCAGTSRIRGSRGLAGVCIILLTQIETILRARLPAPAPAAPPSASPAAPPSAAPTNEFDNQEEYQRANSGVDDRGDNARAKVDAELWQQPPANEGPDYADDKVTDEPKPGALHDLAGKPSCYETDH
jgi:hypothetical protein